MFVMLCAFGLFSGFPLTGCIILRKGTSVRKSSRKIFPPLKHIYRYLLAFPSLALPSAYVQVLVLVQAAERGLSSRPYTLHFESHVVVPSYQIKICSKVRRLVQNLLYNSNFICLGKICLQQPAQIRRFLGFWLERTYQPNPWLLKTVSFDLLDPSNLDQK